MTMGARARRDPRRDPLRIAVVGTRGVPSTYSGLETSTESLYAILAARGHDVTVYCRAGQAAPHGATYRGMTQRFTPAIRGRSIETLSHVATSLAHASLAGAYDLVHLQALAPGLFAPFQRAWRAPTVASIHGLDWQRAKWRGAGGKLLYRAERSIVRHVRDITVVSRDLQRYFRDAYGRETTYVPNGVHQIDDGAVVDSAALDAFGLTRGNYVVYVGRLVPEKRIGDLIAAFRALDTTHRLVLVGDGTNSADHVAELRAAARGDTRIVFTGRLEGAALRAVAASALAFVNPSELEGLPCSLLESIEYRVPAIVSAIPPHREILDDVVGYDLFFPVGDASAITDRLRRVIARSEHYRDIAGEAQRRARQEYSWQAVADRSEELYREIVAREQWKGWKGAGAIVAAGAGGGKS